jgi:hypothetical protein
MHAAEIVMGIVDRHHVAVVLALEKVNSEQNTKVLDWVRGRRTQARAADRGQHSCSAKTGTVRWREESSCDDQYYCRRDSLG